MGDWGQLGGATGKVLTQAALAASVSATHMAMPNHWLPFSLTGRAQHWSLPKTLAITAMGALGHVASTLLASALVSVLGRVFLSEHLLTVVCSVALAVLGGEYIRRWVLQTRATGTPADAPAPAPTANNGGSYRPVHDSSCCEDGHGIFAAEVDTRLYPIEISLIMVPTLSPCVGTLPVLIDCFSSAQTAGAGIVVVIAILFTTVAVMVGLVAASFIGSSAVLDSRLLQRYDKLMIGVSFIALAVISLSIPHNHEHHHHHHIPAVTEPAAHDVHNEIHQHQ